MNKAWQARLDWASSTQDVLQVVGDFLSRWPPREREGIPVDLRPGAFDSAPQVIAYALTLVQRLNGNAKTDPELHRMSTFFTKASLRLFELAEQASLASPAHAPPGRPQRDGPHSPPES